MASIEFKDFLLEKLADAPDEVRTFVRDLGFFFTDQKLIITGPDAPSASISAYVDKINEVAKNWAEENKIAFGKVVVNPNGVGDEINLQDYASRFSIEDEVESSTPVLGSFIEDDEADIVDQDDATPEMSEMSASEGMSTDQLIAQSNQLNGFTSLISRNHEKTNEKQQEEDVDADVNYASEGATSAGIADLLKGTSKLFAKPITVPATLIANSAKRLNEWRLDRPSRMLSLADETSAKLIENISRFKNDEYNQLEAEVKARGGWDFELSQKFEAFLAVGNRKADWKLIVNQVKQFGHYSKKALQTNKDQAQEVMNSIDERAAEVSASASDIPFNVRKGTVVKTVFEATEEFREAIREMVQKMISLIMNVAGKSKSSPTV